MDDGNIAEFMESLFPRAALAPGKDFLKIEMDPENPTGGDGGLFERFRFLGSANIFAGEKKFTMGSHFDLSPKADGTLTTIDWYVTKNIPNEYMDTIKTGVEGWNRYFQSFEGIKRDAVLFKGKLPDNIKIGDPRYNIIVWDNRKVAGAAYESQASDPETGKQSHSLIYLPAAWVKIGADYWTNGTASDPRSLSNKEFKNDLKPLKFKAAFGPKITCARDTSDAVELLLSGRIPEDEIAIFSKELLRATLFHEVGHALGLAHNFAGSLSFDRTNAKASVTNSIMDYNDYELERSAFDTPTSASGPLLEYDRQILSAIYDGSKAIKEETPSVPVCNDEETDAEEGGVNPLCMRYDVEKDPTLAIQTAFDRVEKEVMPETYKLSEATLAQALSRVPGLVLNDKAVGATSNSTQMTALITKAKASLQGTINFYYSGSRLGISRAVRMNAKSLLQFGEGVLLEGYSEQELRERALAGIEKELALKTLPDAVKKSIEAAKALITVGVLNTPAAKNMSYDEKATVAKTITTKMDEVAKAIENTEKGLFVKMKASLLVTLARHEKVPYFFGKIGDKQVDIEANIVKLLSDTLVGSVKSPMLMRTSAATSLATFKGRPIGDDAIADALTKLKTEYTKTMDNESREAVQGLMDALKAESTKE
jgi:hypothetical protein